MIMVTYSPTFVFDDHQTEEIDLQAEGTGDEAEETPYSVSKRGNQAPRSSALPETRAAPADVVALVRPVVPRMTIPKIRNDLAVEKTAQEVAAEVINLYFALDEPGQQLYPDCLYNAQCCGAILGQLGELANTFVKDATFTTDPAHTWETFLATLANGTGIAKEAQAFRLAATQGRYQGTTLGDLFASVHRLIVWAIPAMCRSSPHQMDAESALLIEIEARALNDLLHH
eukprot:m51a1_g3426 hypothetical protein (229) ;mRNA; r:608222-609958